MIKSNRKGYTLIELLLAMSLFVSVMVIATTGFIGMNRTFSRGLARKQLSESVQRTVEDLTRSINSAGTVDSAGSIINGLGSVVIGSNIFYYTTDNGGLYRTNTVNRNPDKDYELLGGRFKVAALEVYPVNDDKNLYKVKGVFHTNESGAVNLETPEDIYSTVCKGTSESGASTQCALEKFEFVINTASGGE